MARYRHRVFIEKLGWQLRCEDGLEHDQFDRDDTVYVIAKDDDENIIGTARLLPTTRPYLLGQVFPELLDGLPIPNSDEVWELSRFAAVDFNDKSFSALSQFSSSPIAVGLLRQALQTAVKHGAKRVITVSPLGVERLLARARFKAHRIGKPIEFDGQMVVACNIHASV